MSRNSLLEAGAKSEGEVTATGVEPRTTWFLNEECGFTLKRVHDMTRTYSRNMTVL